MATKPTKQDEQFVAPHEKQEQRAEAARLIAEGLEHEARGSVLQGQGLLLAQSTYSLDEQDDFQKWATKHTRKAWETCRSLMAIAKANAQLPRKEQREKAATLTFEQGQVLASVPDEDRVEWLKAIGPTTTPTEARKVRDDISLGKLSEKERKEKEQAKATRETKRAAEKEAELIAAIKDGVLTAERSGDIRNAMSFAAQLVNGPGRTGEKVSEAIVAIFRSQDEAKAKLDAMKAEAEAEGARKATASKEKASK